MYQTEGEIVELVKRIKNSYKNPNDRAKKGCHVAKLYHNIGQHKTALRFLDEFDKVKPNHPNSLNLRGNIFDSLSQSAPVESNKKILYQKKALDAYRGSFESDDTQTDLLLTIVQLMQCLPTEDESTARYWLQEARNNFPDNKTLKKLATKINQAEERPGAAVNIQSDCHVAAVNIQSDCQVAADNIQSDCQVAAVNIQSDCQVAADNIQSDCQVAADNIQSNCQVAAVNIQSDCHVESDNIQSEECQGAEANIQPDQKGPGEETLEDLPPVVDLNYENGGNWFRVVKTFMTPNGPTTIFEIPIDDEDFFTMEVTDTSKAPPKAPEVVEPVSTSVPAKKTPKKRGRTRRCN